VRTAYPSFFNNVLKSFNKDSSFSTSNADLDEVFMLLVGGKEGSGGLGGLGSSNCLVSIKERECAIFFTASKELLINYCTRRGLICWLLSVDAITEVIVGKRYLQPHDRVRR
jgi:hypothetical protein